MSTIINYKCRKCDFTFQDKDLIFYSENKKIKIESLTMENSKKMTESPLSGYLYENYCPHCNELIETYVPETKSESLSNKEMKKILKILKEENNKPKSFKNNAKILFFDFENTFYKERRQILENNTCPNCKKEMSLVISEKIPCPQCGGKLEEIHD